MAWSDVVGVEVDCAAAVMHLDVVGESRQWKLLGAPSTETGDARLKPLKKLKSKVLAKKQLDQT